MLLSGCVAPNPEWLSADNSFCSAGVNQECLSAYGNAQFDKAVAAQVPDDLGRARLAFGLAVIGSPRTFENVDSAESAEVDSIPIIELYSQAGVSIAKAEDGNYQEVLAEIEAISDPDVVAFGIDQLLAIHADDMGESITDTALNALYLLDEGAYQRALSVKLSALLGKGDFERAAALRRQLLLGNENTAHERAFSMLALVVATYTIAGLDDDVYGIFKESLGRVRELSADDLKLVKVAVESAKGGYPSQEFFYDFRSDQVRLEAYLTVATLAYRLDKPSLARDSLSDALRFIQKSGTKVDLQLATSQILALSKTSKFGTQVIH